MPVINLSHHHKALYESALAWWKQEQERADSMDDIGIGMNGLELYCEAAKEYEMKAQAKVEALSAAMNLALERERKANLAMQPYFRVDTPAQIAPGMIVFNPNVRREVSDNLYEGVADNWHQRQLDRERERHEQRDIAINLADQLITERQKRIDAELAEKRAIAARDEARCEAAKWETMASDHRREIEALKAELAKLEPVKGFLQAFSEPAPYISEKTSKVSRALRNIGNASKSMGLPLHDRY